MNIQTASPLAIKHAAQVIRKGGLVIFPTETVYGLGANALNALSCARIFEIKNRPEFNPLIVHIHERNILEKIVKNITDKAAILMKEFWPGPLTLILDKSDLVPDIVTAGLDTVAVRMPQHPLALKLIQEMGVPLAAPSANPFGYLSPTTIEDIDKKLTAQVDLILDGGKTSIGIESTILNMTSEPPVLLRYGGLPVEEIEKIIGKIQISIQPVDKPQAPGQLAKHYSPYTPIKILTKPIFQLPANQKIGLLAFRPPKDNIAYYHIEILSNIGDIREAAMNFFTALHRLDNKNLDWIYAEPIPETGLGRAMMDRLYRAGGLAVI